MCQKQVYTSKWKNKRNVLAIITHNQICMIIVKHRLDREKPKLQEVKSQKSLGVTKGYNFCKYRFVQFRNNLLQSLIDSKKTFNSM